MRDRRHLYGRGKSGNFDARAIGRNQFGLTTRNQHRVIAKDAQQPGGSLSVLLHPHPQAIARKHRHAGIISRKNFIHPHPKGFGEKWNIISQLFGR